MNWRKVAAGIAVSLLTVSLLAGCGSKNEAPKATDAPKTTADAPKEKIELEWWGWWASAQRKPTIDKIVKDWNDKHPDVQVKYVYVPWDQILTKYVASVAAGNPPDVCSTDLALLPMRANKKQAMDLSTLGAAAMKDEFFPNFWNAVTFNGKPYALPWMGDSRFLYYNTDHFKEVGLDPAKGPVTWDDLWKFADKLDKIENGKIARAGFYPLAGNFATTANISSQANVQGWILNAKGTMFDNRAFPAINSDVTVQTFDWVKKWDNRYGRSQIASFMANFQGGAVHPFTLGKLSMVVETPTFMGEALKNNPNLKMARVPVPTPDGVQHPAAALSSGFGIEIPANSKHPKEAFEFAKYWATEAAAVWTVEQNDFPANKKVADSIKTDAFQAVVKQMTNTTYMQTPLYAPAWADAIKPAVDDLLAGKKDSKAALADAQKALTDMVRDNSNK